MNLPGTSTGTFRNLPATCPETAPATFPEPARNLHRHLHRSIWLETQSILLLGKMVLKCVALSESEIEKLDIPQLNEELEKSGREPVNSEDIGLVVDVYDDDEEVRDFARCHRLQRSFGGFAFSLFLLERRGMGRNISLCVSIEPEKSFRSPTSNSNEHIRERPR